VKVPDGEKKRMRLFSSKEKAPNEDKGPKEQGTVPMLAPKPDQPGGTPSLKDETTEPISDARSKELEKEEAVLRLMIDLEIDENRARALTDAGYRSRVDLTDAIPQDLIQVKGINPTMAKKMIEKAKAPLPQ
jgi:replicative superfamily II helicase